MAAFSTGWEIVCCNLILLMAFIVTGEDGGVAPMTEVERYRVVDELGEIWPSLAELQDEVVLHKAENFALRFYYPLMLWIDRTKDDVDARQQHAATLYCLKSLLLMNSIWIWYINSTSLIGDRTVFGNTNVWADALLGFCQVLTGQPRSLVRSFLNDCVDISDSWDEQPCGPRLGPFRDWMAQVHTYLTARSGYEEDNVDEEDVDVDNMDEGIPCGDAIRKIELFLYIGSRYTINFVAQCALEDGLTGVTVSRVQNMFDSLDEGTATDDAECYKVYVLGNAEEMNEEEREGARHYTEGRCMNEVQRINWIDEIHADSPWWGTLPSFQLMMGNMLPHLAELVVA